MPETYSYSDRTFAFLKFQNFANFHHFLRRGGGGGKVSIITDGGRRNQPTLHANAVIASTHS
jgi:hypothetical protein